MLRPLIFLLDAGYWLPATCLQLPTAYRLLPTALPIEAAVRRRDLQGGDAVLRLTRQKLPAELEVVRGLLEGHVRLPQRRLELALGLRESPRARQHHAEVVVARREPVLRAPDGLPEVLGRSHVVARARREHAELVVCGRVAGLR